MSKREPNAVLILRQTCVAMRPHGRLRVNDGNVLNEIMESAESQIAGGIAATAKNGGRGHKPPLG